MNRDDTVSTVLQNRLRRTIPRELGIALIAKNWDSMRATPHCGCTQIVNSASRIGRTVDPQQQRSLRVVFADGIQIDSAAIVTRHGNCATPGQSCTHFVRRVRNSWVQNGVEPW